MNRRTILKALPFFGAAATPAVALEPPTPADVIGQHAKAISDHLAARQMTCEVVVNADSYRLDFRPAAPVAILQGKGSA